VDAVDQRVRGESPEDDSVRRADARAGEHGDGQLGSHTHVDGDSVAFFNTERLEHIGEFLHFAMKLLIREGADFAGLAFPDNSGLILAVRRNVPVEAVIRKIDLAADEPLRPWTIPFENFVPFLEPVQFAGDAAPKLVGIVDRFPIESLVLGEILFIILLAENGRRRETALFLQNGIDAAGLHVG
jgi:hypothetical protein